MSFPCYLLIVSSVTLLDLWETLPRCKTLVLSNWKTILADAGKNCFENFNKINSKPGATVENLGLLSLSRARPGTNMNTPDWGQGAAEQDWKSHSNVITTYIATWLSLTDPM